MIGPRNLYRINTTGCLGGVALVFAESPEMARQTAKTQYPEYAEDFDKGEISQIMIPLFDSVIYFDDGDY